MSCRMRLSAARIVTFYFSSFPFSRKRFSVLHQSWFLRVVQMLPQFQCRITIVCFSACEVSPSRWNAAIWPMVSRALYAMEDSPSIASYSDGSFC